MKPSQVLHAVPKYISGTVREGYLEISSDDLSY